MEYEWHGLLFVVDYYYESGPGIDPNAVQIELQSSEVVDAEEASLWPHGIPVTNEDWRKVWRAAIDDIAQWVEEDIEAERQEARVERMIDDY